MIDTQETNAVIALVRKLKLGPLFQYQITERGNGLGHWVHTLWNTHIYFYLETYGVDKGKITIGMGFPKDKFGEYHMQYLGNSLTQPSIKVSGKKTPEQVSTDIERRFMPDFLKLSELCAERIANSGARLDAMVSNGKAIKAAYPELVLRDSISSTEQHRRLSDGVSLHSSYDIGGSHTTITVSQSDMSLKVDNLSLEETLLVLATIKEFRS